MEKFKNPVMVLPRDLNHHGTLFAGQAMYYLVESGFVCVSSYYDPDHIVFRGLDHVGFFKPVKKGSILIFEARAVYFGKTSIKVHVKAAPRGENETSIEGIITYVTVDDNGKKTPHNLKISKPEDKDEELLRNLCNR